MADNHVLVDTADKAADAIKVLKSYTQLSVDCEGVNLTRDGELCLMQIAIPNKVYLFDIVVLRDQVFDMGLRSILEGTGITKLFYDCREDCNALKHQYNVNVQGIEDIQLITVLNMKVHGKRWQFASGLQKCMDYNLRGCGFSGTEKERVHKELDKDKTLWRKRPISSDFIAYATKDVLYLSRLRDTIYSKMTRSPVTKSRLVDLIRYSSERYADFMRNNDGYPMDSPYFRTARLPERILPELNNSSNGLPYTPFPTSGSKCRTCCWLTEISIGGQCKRCCAIDDERGQRR